MQKKIQYKARADSKLLKITTQTDNIPTRNEIGYN